MKCGKLISVLLMICILAGCLSVAAFARVNLYPVIVLDQTVTVETAEGSIICYSYTAEEDGPVVLYGLDERAELDTVSVYGVSPDEPGFEEQLIVSGNGRAAFTAVAGSTYWFVLDCWTAGSVVSHSFTLARPVEPGSMELVCDIAEAGFVGSEGSIALNIYPINGGGEILWTSSDPAVVTVSGDAQGARYQLVGEGTATITASAANGCSASVQISAVEKLVVQPGEDKTVLIPGNQGDFHSFQKTFYFTPEQSDMYSFSVSYDELLHVDHNLQMSVLTADGRIYDDQNLIFQAEAGVEYAIEVEFWGHYDADSAYVFSLRPCVTGESFRLEAEPDSGFAGGFLYVWVRWDSVDSRPEELTWTTSDPSVAAIGTAGQESASIDLVGPGTATITATNATGLSAAVDIVVLQPLGAVELVPGSPNSLTLPGNGSAEVRFTPQQSGYYQLVLDNDLLQCYFEDAESLTDNGRLLYLMEAGVTYSGYVESSADTLTTGSISLELTELRKITAMKITALPDNTTYLKAALDDVWTYQLLAGLEMTISWSDGTQIRWSFDQEGPFVDREDLRWELVSTDDRTELVLGCGDVTASCELTVLDVTVTGIRLADETPLRLVEDSCGIRLEDGSWYYMPYLAYARDVQILFSDGSSVTARADELVYGNMLLLEEDQSGTPWIKGGDHSVTFSYLDHTVELPVEIVDSPVERIELTKVPRDTFLLGDDDFFSGTAGRYFFSPQDLKEVLEGIEFTIVYRDGATKRVTDADLEWVEMMGVVCPCVDGYPIGLFSKLYADQYPVTGPGDHEGLVEYMGASAVYTIHFVDELPQKPEEQLPPTGDLKLAPVLLLGLLACGAVLLGRKRYL